MNVQTAHALINAEMQRLRQMPYAELAALVGNPATREVVGDDGKSYQMEIEAIWDSANGEDVRVIVAVDDGGWRAFKPLIDDFIMRPDGTLVGQPLNG